MNTLVMCIYDSRCGRKEACEKRSEMNGSMVSWPSLSPSLKRDKTSKQAKNVETKGRIEQ